jgi:chromate reductase
MKKFIAISGSLRKDSLNTHLLKAAVEIASADSQIEIVDISRLPLFNEDLETEFPKVVQDFKDKIVASDGVIFATPEYNRSIPGVLKNAIDWASRPYGKNAFAKKSVLILGASGGPIGTAVAQSHLKQIMLYLDSRVIGQPEFYLGKAQEKFDKDGALIDEQTKDHLKQALEVLINH